MNYIFTSESVSEGHPDKICDQISDAILDEFMRRDPNSRVAIETLATTNKVVIAGEVRGPDSIDKNVMEQITRQVIKDIGYEQEGFDWKNVVIDNYVHQQSADIAKGVDANDERGEGAGDQGLMFGYACNETNVYMPAAIFYCHQILKELAKMRHNGQTNILGPDAKSQLALIYDNGKPIKAESVLVSTQHIKQASLEEIRELVRKLVVKILPEGWMCQDKRFLVNPTGIFVIGGPDGDSGLTGRKIIVDTYGGAAPHGGGAFSGKDPTKVDRSAAYAARYLAKNVVAAGLADKCLIQLSYAIGVVDPISFYINCDNSNNVDLVKLAKILQEMVHLSPRGIRKKLDLSRPIYLKTATYGHFGRESEDGFFPWEKLDLVEDLKRAF